MKNFSARQRKKFFGSSVLPKNNTAVAFRVFTHKFSRGLFEENNR